MYENMDLIVLVVEMFKNFKVAKGELSELNNRSCRF